MRVTVIKLDTDGTHCVVDCIYDFKPDAFETIDAAMLHVGAIYDREFDLIADYAWSREECDKLASQINSIQCVVYGEYCPR